MIALYMYVYVGKLYMLHAFYIFDLVKVIFLKILLFLIYECFTHVCLHR